MLYLCIYMAKYGFTYSVLLFVISVIFFFQPEMQQNTILFSGNVSALQTGKVADFLLDNQEEESLWDMLNSHQRRNTPSSPSKLYYLPFVTRISGPVKNHFIPFRRIPPSRAVLCIYRI